MQDFCRPHALLVVATLRHLLDAWSRGAHAYSCCPFRCRGGYAGRWHCLASGCCRYRLTATREARQAEVEAADTKASKAASACLTQPPRRRLRWQPGAMQALPPTHASSESVALCCVCALMPCCRLVKMAELLVPLPSCSGRHLHLGCVAQLRGLGVATNCCARSAATARARVPRGLDGPSRGRTAPALCAASAPCV